jgi:hypothetical protein
MEEVVNRTTAETAEALDWLESRGYLKRVPSVGSEDLLALNEARSAEVADFLARTQNDDGETTNR